MKTSGIFLGIYVFLAAGWMVLGPRSLSWADESTAASSSNSPPGFKPQAPHGGLLLDAGDDFAHVEMVFDPVKGSLSAYILDGEAEEAVPLKQSTILVRLTQPAKSLKLKAVISPLIGEKLGAASSYSLVDPFLKGLSRLKGALVSVDFNGRVFKNLAFQFFMKK